MVNHIKKIAGFFTLAMVLVFAGCSGLVNGSVSTEDTTQRGTIAVSLTEIASRAAMAPATLTFNDDGIDHYEVSGTSKTGLTFGPAAITKASLVASPVEAKLEKVPYDDWTFTMTAYATSDTSTPVLKGTSVCNMKSGSETSVAFTLSSYGLATAGSYAITIKYDNTSGAWKDAAYSFTWGLYDPITGKVLTDQGVESTDAAATSVGTTDAPDIHMAKSDTGKKDTANDYYLAAKTGVTPGSYIFGVTINNGSSKLGYASAGLVIEPGRETKATLELDANIIQSSPTAPAGLFAQRIEGSENDDFYDVRFAWQDKSNNEEGFELVLRKFENTSSDWTVYEADAVIAGSAGVEYLYDWGTILTLTSSTDTVKYVAGSLYSGSQELVLRFPMGTLYDVQLRSVNSVGKSAAIARAADTAAAETLEKTTATESAPSPTSTKTFLDGYGSKKVTGIPIGAAGKNKHISLVKITYWLDGGTLTLAGTAQASTKTYVEYKPYELETDGANEAAKYIPLLVIKPAATATASENKLVRSGTDWSKWVLSSSATTVTDSTDSLGYNTNAYQNFSVLAIYGTTAADISVGVPTIRALAHESFTDDALTAYYGTEATTAMSTNACKNSQIKIPWGSAAQYVTVTVSTNALFSRYVLYVGENPIEEKAYVAGTLSFSNFSTDRLASGGASTCIRVDAFTAGGEMASASFYIQKVN